MPISKVRVQGSRRLILGYTCSCCKNPIVRVVDLQLTVVREFMLFAGKAKEEAQETLNRALQNKVDEILNLRKGRGTEIKMGFDCPSYSVGSNLYGDGSYTGLGAPGCPYCGQVESWQNTWPLGKGTKEKAPFESLPIELKDNQDIDKLVKERLESRLRKFVEKRKNISELTEVLKRYKELEYLGDAYSDSVRKSHAQDEIKRKLRAEQEECAYIIKGWVPSILSIKEGQATCFYLKHSQE